MSTLQRLVTTGALALSLGTTGCRTRSTESDEIGIAYCKFACGKEKIQLVPPGQTQFFMPGRWDWYTLPTSVQTVYMTKKQDTGDRKTEDDLVFKSIEGNDIGQDIVITYRIDHLVAQKIIETVGGNIREIQEKYVRPLVRSITRDFLNVLRSNEFYESQKRFEQAEKATAELKLRFAHFGILLDKIDLKDYRFQDPNYQEAINNAKNAQQFRGKAAGEVESQRNAWKTALENQKATSNQLIAEADGKLAQARLETDAVFIERQNNATATLREKTAEAQGKVKLREAMASAGGNTAVMMAYAQHFNPDQILILPCNESGGMTLNRLNLNDLIGGEAAQGK